MPSVKPTVNRFLGVQMNQGSIQLGELEHAVLEELWEQGANHAKGVHARLGVQRGITHNTVQSTLERLYRKALLSRTKEGHAYVYRPALEREAFLARLIEQVTHPLADNLPEESLLSAFVDFADEKDEQGLDRLQALIERKRQARSSHGDGS